MKNTIKKFLFAGDTFMPEMHLRQPAFTYSACQPFIKNNERIQISKTTTTTNKKQKKQKT